MNYFSKFAVDDMSGTVHKEKEIRVSLKSLPEECKDLKPTIINQGILREIKNGDYTSAYARVRMKKDPGKDPQYSLGVKNFDLNQEAETEISKEMFNKFYPDNVSKPQKKERFNLDNGWIIDKKNDGDIVAEYELKGKEKIPEPPEDWDVMKKASWIVKMAMEENTKQRLISSGKGALIGGSTSTLIPWIIHSKAGQELFKGIEGGPKLKRFLILGLPKALKIGLIGTGVGAGLGALMHKQAADLAGERTSNRNETAKTTIMLTGLGTAGGSLIGAVEAVRHHKLPGGFFKNLIKRPGVFVKPALGGMTTGAGMSAVESAAEGPILAHMQKTDREKQLNRNPTNALK